MVAHKIVCRAGHGHAGLEQFHFELPQTLGAAVILVSGQRAHVHSAADGGGQGLRHFAAVETEDHDVDALASLLDGIDDRRQAGIRLNDELHTLSTTGAASCWPTRQMEPANLAGTLIARSNECEDRH